MRRKLKWRILNLFLLSDPIIKRADPEKRVYLRTDFSSIGFGFVVLQPGDDVEGLAAMRREIDGGLCEFDLTKKSPRLYPCAFGAKKIAGYQKHVHGSLGA